MPELARITPITLEEPAAIGTALHAPFGEIASSEALPVAMTAAMTKPRRPRRNVAPADGSYTPAFPIPARAGADEANEVFEHYKPGKKIQIMSMPIRHSLK